MANPAGLKDSSAVPRADVSPTSRTLPRSSRPRTASSSLTKPRSSSTRATGKRSRRSSSTSSNSTGSTGSIYSVQLKTWEQLISHTGALSKDGSIMSPYFKSVLSLLAGFESKRKISTSYTILSMTSPSLTSRIELCGYTNGREDFMILITISGSNDLK